MSTLKIGLLGASRIAPPAIVYPASELTHVEVVSVAARDSNKAIEFASAHRLPCAAESYSDLIHDPNIDLIYNALPISEHARWSIQALNAGKHVLCEKPFAMNHAEAVAMTNAAIANQKRLIEAFHYRYHPAFEQLLKWLRDGRVGAVKKIDASFNIGIPYSEDEIRHRPDTGGGAMMDLGCYPLNWILEIGNAPPEIIEASAICTAAGVDEFMSAKLRMGDVAASISCDMRANAPFRAALSILGTAGRIEFSNPLAPHNGGELTLINGETVHAPISETVTYRWQLEAVANAIVSNTPLPTEGDAILRQQSALDDVYAAAGLGHLRQQQ